MATPRLLFLHLHKTGGTTLRSILRRNHPTEEIFDIGRDTETDLRTFVGLPERARARFRVLQGHMTFGLHALLPAPTRYVTILRHPVSRVASYHRFVAEQPDHPLHPAVRELSLLEFLDAGLTVQPHDFQTRMLAGASREDAPGMPSERPLCEADLDRAREHLERHFYAVGVQERFEESVLLMGRALGWRHRSHGRENATRAPVRVGPAERARIEALNPLDLRLYAFVRERFTRSVRAAGPGLQASRLLLRGRNRVRGVWPPA